MGYSTKKSIHKFFGTALTTCIDFQFNNLKFSQKGILDFHVTTATADLYMKEVIASLFRRALSRKIMEALKTLILSIIVLNLDRKDLSFYYTAIFRGHSMT